MMDSGDSATLPLSTTSQPHLAMSGLQNNPTRPSTLFTQEKEPINFEINLVGAPVEVEQLIEHIKAVAEQFLFHWKTFPISMYKIVILLGILEYLIYMLIRLR